MKSYGRVISLIIMSCFLCHAAEAAKSAVKGDPELLWLSPLGKGNIENTPYNQCLLIKQVKPSGSAEKLNENIYELLAEYTANLYAQSIKINAYLQAETKKEKTIKLGKINDEVSIIKKLILRRLADISRRVNIINSLEAGTSMLETLMAMSLMGNDTYKSIEDCCETLSADQCGEEPSCMVKDDTCVAATK